MTALRIGLLVVSSAVLVSLLSELVPSKEKIGRLTTPSEKARPDEHMRVVPSQDRSMARIDHHNRAWSDRPKLSPRQLAAVASQLALLDRLEQKAFREGDDLLSQKVAAEEMKLLTTASRLLP